MFIEKHNNSTHGLLGSSEGCREMPLPSREELLEEARRILDRALLRLHALPEEEAVREALKDAAEAYADLLLGYLEDIRKLYRDGLGEEPSEEELAQYLDRMRRLHRTGLDCLIHPAVLDGYLAQLAREKTRRHILVKCPGWDNRYLLLEGSSTEDIVYALLAAENPVEVYREMLRRQKQ